MRSREVKVWLDALVKYHGNDAFDREVAAHVIDVLALVEGSRCQNLEGSATIRRDTPEGEMAHCTVKLLRARADATPRQTCKVRIGGEVYGYVEETATFVPGNDGYVKV
jgi:hypothetical protein